MELELPLRYAFLEIGDILTFSEGPYQNELIFGEDYSEVIVRNGQYILPLFMIYHISISDKIVIKARQIHHSNPNTLAWRGQPYYQLSDDSATWDGINPDIGGEWNDGGYDGGTPQDDEEGGEDLYPMGDVNFDGTLDILDVIGMVNEIIDPPSLHGEALAQGDMNGDGVVNIQDVILVVNNILNP